MEAADEEGLKSLRRGWCVSGEAFRKEQLGRMEGKLGEHHAGELRRETAEAKGERIIAEELARWGWPKSELTARRKNDADKLAIAARLRRETTLSIKAIAARVRLGTSKSTNARVHQAMSEAVAPTLTQSGTGIERKTNHAMG